MWRTKVSAFWPVDVVKELGISRGFLGKASEDGGELKGSLKNKNNGFQGVCGAPLGYVRD